MKEDIRKEYEAKLSSMNEKLKTLKNTYEHKQQENKVLEDSLTKLIPKIHEANLCAEKFNKDVVFET